MLNFFCKNSHQRASFFQQKMSQKVIIFLEPETQCKNVSSYFKRFIRRQKTLINTLPNLIIHF